MRRKKCEPMDPAFAGCAADPAYEIYMKKCLKRYPFLYKMIDYIVDCKIAALRAEIYHMGMCHPMHPDMMYAGMPYPGIAGPAGVSPFHQGYPMMPM